MPEHPTLRIHSPRPDIQVVAKERQKVWLMERTSRRLASFMITVAMFFLLNALFMTEWIFVVVALVSLCAAICCMGASEKFVKLNAETPTRDSDAGFFV
jgi:hypothetical protein